METEHVSLSSSQVPQGIGLFSALQPSSCICVHGRTNRTSHKSGSERHMGCGTPSCVPVRQGEWEGGRVWEEQGGDRGTALSYLLGTSLCCFLSGPPLPPGPHLSPGILPGVHSQVQGRVYGQAEVVRREYRGQRPSCWNSLPSSALCLPFRQPHVWFLTQTVEEHLDDSEVWL